MKPSAPPRYSDLSPSLLRRLWIGFAAALTASLVLEIFIPRYGYFGWDSLPFVYAALGFAACALIVGVSNLLGCCLKQPEPHDGED